MKSLLHVFTVLFLVMIAQVLSAQIDLDKLSDMEFRSVGPAGMSGRVTTIGVVERDRNVIYVGTASGGLWKSENEGIDWKPIFDDQPDHSIGDIAIFQKNPNIIYLGTGEGNPRNSQSSGNGMYKTIDGGKNWTKIGLEESRNIHRVVVHPDDPDIVYAGVQGSAWMPTPVRGVYKSTDGGSTWEQILFVNDTTGIADLVMDPSNPNKLIAAMWHFWRRPWYMESGGPGSGIHMTSDGGKNWTKITSDQGIPEGELGRIGLAIAPGKPDVVYARVEAKKDGLYRSNDGGTSWKLQADKDIGNRPFYYSDIFVDPSNENRIYNLSSTLKVSEDGGKTHRDLASFFQVHPDHHALWINPDDPAHILNGNDGGLYSTMDGGETWQFHDNLPVGQFYHISVDQAIPYHVMGGMQDNGSWSGPAYKWEAMGHIRNNDFRSVGFGDGFDVIPDPEDPRYGYSLWQGGNFMRWDKHLGLEKLIAPVSVDDVDLRWNWNSAIAQDPFDASTVYVGSQFVHRSRDKGRSWEVISPDLTTDDPEKQQQATTGGLTVDNTTAENHCSILVIEPSSLEEGVIWVGTDDGNVQITQDGGATWTNVVNNIRESDRIYGNESTVPPNTWVCQIRASTYNPGAAFVVFDDHRRNNWEPYVYKTENYGRTWRRLVDSSDVRGYALSVVQDHIEPNLIFTGTEFGLWVSFDGGDSWQQMRNGLPTCSVMDMVIHPREGDLVLGTFGRSIWILDDLNPLREIALDTAIVRDTAHLFEPPGAYQAVVSSPDFIRIINDTYKATNRPIGALLSYWVADTTGLDTVMVTVYDQDGEVFRELKSVPRPGLNRLTWDLKKKQAEYPGPPNPWSDMFSSGPEALPGEYLVTLSAGTKVDTQRLDVQKDPAMPIPLRDFRTNVERKERHQSAVATVARGYKELEQAEKQLSKIRDFLSDRKDSTAMAVTTSIDSLQKKLTILKERAVPGESKGIPGETGDLVSRLRKLGSYFQNSMTPPGEPEEVLLKKMETHVSRYQDDVEQFMQTDYAGFARELEEAQLMMLIIDAGAKS